MTLIVGIVLVTGVLFPNSPDRFMTQVMGAVFILWGIYRIIIYRNNLKRYKGINDEEPEE